MKCVICGQPLGRNKIACSMACYAKLKTNMKTCIICGKEFADSQGNMTKTCSPECSSANRKQLHEHGVYDGTLKKAHEAFTTNPLTGRFETNVNAKEWVIQSPDGDIYTCRNLMLWLREHEDMLDGTVIQAWNGIVQIKHSMLGKRKNKSYQWKGWKLIEWGD
jgi:predicted nucleic acid-binding Zn ribbon protein